jgi:hypothetical protein
MCLSLLNDTLAYGRQRLGEQWHLTPDERAELLNHLATLYRWFALVAIGLVPKEELAEEALRQSLTIFLELQDLTAAEDIYQDFAETVAKRGDVWSPQPQTSALWEQVMARAQAARQAQQSRKKRRPVGEKSHRC